MSALVEIRDLNVSKSGKSICRISDLTVNNGERLAVIGPNGSGKTTLLRVLGRLELQYTGKCESDIPRRQRIYVHQTPYMFRGSVLFNAMYGLRSHGIARQEAKRSAIEWLTRLGIEHLAERSCRDLSGGEKRRVALARALALEPKLLLLDEPLADLDDEGINDVCRALEHLSHSTVIVASPVEPPSQLCNRHLHLKASLQ